MKNSLVTVMVLVFIIMLCTGTVKAASIGYIDVQEVYSSYDKTKSMKKISNKKKENFKTKYPSDKKNWKKNKIKVRPKRNLESLSKHSKRKLNPKRMKSWNFKRKH